MSRRTGMPLFDATAVGIYEKALAGEDWAANCEQAASAGYSFVELSVDDSPERLARLTWSKSTRRKVRQTAASAGVHVGTIVLSAHRSFPWGSADSAVRQRADELAAQAIDLAADLSADRVQIAGYFAFDGPRHNRARDCFIHGIQRAADVAETRAIRLAIENMDGSDVISASDAIALIRDIDRENVRLYPDLGNFAGNGLDAARELRAALPWADAVQLKDAKRGAFRRIQFGDGLVDWPAAIRVLLADSWHGPISIEMWNDSKDPELAGAALNWLQDQARGVTSPAGKHYSK
ncbi:L-ribulose-5-phosphate 3-epimerase [Agromyces sp. NPDC058104]|uniref:L-ribulose-5-phosphate 3-epimerase n=1 Tax=Agromyces sp. NPDC058104 TaxID=3346342 RepID=UPI0036D7CB24